MKISEAWPLYERDKKMIRYSPYTLKAYKIQCRVLVRALGDIEISEITRDMLKDYLAGLTHLKPSSIAHRHRFLQSFSRWAIDEGHISKNPMSGIKEPRIDMRVPKFLTEEEVITLKASCKMELERAIVEFMYSTGCRVGEITQVNKADIKWETNSLIVHGKGSRDREVFFSLECRIWLKRYLQMRHDEDPALFVTERAPRRMGIAQMRYIIKRIAKRADMNTSVYPHRMRHAFAMHMLDNGAPKEAIGEMMGHCKRETTDIYCQYSSHHKKEIYQRYF